MSMWVWWPRGHVSSHPTERICCSRQCLLHVFVFSCLCDLKEAGAVDTLSNVALAELSNQISIGVISPIVASTHKAILRTRP